MNHGRSHNKKIESQCSVDRILKNHMATCDAIDLVLSYSLLVIVLRLEQSLLNHKKIPDFRILVFSIYFENFKRFLSIMHLSPLPLSG